METAPTRPFRADVDGLRAVAVLAVGRTVRTLRSLGTAVLVLGPVADPHDGVPACLSAHLDAATACAPARAMGVNGPGVAAEAAAVQQAGGRCADFTDLFCTSAVCPDRAARTSCRRGRRSFPRHVDTGETVNGAQLLQRG